MKLLESSNSMNFEEEIMKGEMNVDDANVEMVNMEENETMDLQTQLCIQLQL
jgi:hypothetical protein